MIRLHQGLDTSPSLDVLQATPSFQMWKNFRNQIQTDALRLMDPLLGHTPISNSFPGDSEWYPRGFHRLLDVLMFRIDRHVVALCDLLNCLELLRENTRILLRCLLQVWILSRLGLGLELLHILQEIFRNRLDVFFIELRARQPLQLGDQLLVFLGWLFGRTNLKLLCDRLELIVEFRAILRDLLSKLFDILALRFLLRQLPQLNFGNIAFQNGSHKILI